ncbi:unnamed protein product [Phaeothamnion confervicola]
MECRAEVCRKWRGFSLAIFSLCISPAMPFFPFSRFSCSDVTTRALCRQVVIFCSKTNRATELARLLCTCNFPAVVIHGGLAQDERIKRYQEFKAFQSRILVTTDLFGRGIDIERVNIVVNYDFPDNSDQYLHRVGRAGRFGTKGLAVSFVSSKEDSEMLASVQGRFEVDIPELPDTIDTTTYMSQDTA